MLKFQSPVVLQLQDGELLSVDGVQAIRLPAGARALVGAEGPAQVSLVAAPSWWQALRREASKWGPRFTARRPSWISPPTN